MNTQLSEEKRPWQEVVLLCSGGKNQHISRHRDVI